MKRDDYQYKITAHKGQFIIEVMASKTFGLFSKWYTISHYRDPLFELTGLMDSEIEKHSFLGQTFCTWPLMFKTPEEASRAIRLFKKGLKNPDRRIFVYDSIKIKTIEELFSKQSNT